MKARPSIYFVIATLVFAAGIVVYSLTYDYLESKLLPVIIAGVVLILGSLQLGIELRIPKNDPGEKSSVEQAPSYALVKSGPSAAWIIGFCLALYVLGFLIAIPLFVFSYMKSRGRGWGASIFVPVVLTLCIYLIFTTFLNVDLYPGLIFEHLFVVR